MKRLFDISEGCPTLQMEMNRWHIWICFLQFDQFAFFYAKPWSVGGLIGFTFCNHRRPESEFQIARDDQQFTLFTGRIQEIHSYSQDYEASVCACIGDSKCISSCLLNFQSCSTNFFCTMIFHSKKSLLCFRGAPNGAQSDVVPQTRCLTPARMKNRPPSGTGGEWVCLIIILATLRRLTIFIRYLKLASKKDKNHQGTELG